MNAGRCAQLALTIAATACAWAVQADDAGKAL